MPSLIEVAKNLFREVVQSAPTPKAGVAKNIIREVAQPKLNINLIVPGAAMPPAKAPPLNPATFRDTTPVDAVPTTALPMGRRKPKNQSALAGKIVFGANAIANSAALTADSAELRAAFDANDTIHMRAFWPHALCDYPIGVNRSNGAPVYGPATLGETHKLHLVLDCFIDGRRVEAPGQRPTASWAVHPEHETDFYAGVTSCSNCMVCPFIDSPDEPWDAIGNRLRRAYKLLPAGDHTVRVDLRFRVEPIDEDIPSDMLGTVLQPTLLSAPIATGSFTVAIPASPGDIKLAGVLAPRPADIPLSDEEAAEYEAATLALLQGSSGWGKRASKTEHVFHVTMTSGWHVTMTKPFNVGGTIVQEPVQRGIACNVYFYRSPATGWPTEEIAVFDLTALSAEQRDPKAELPFVHVAVGGCSTFDVGLLPDEALEMIKSRCPNAPAL